MPDILDKFQCLIMLEECNEFAANWLSLIGNEQVDDMLEGLRRLCLDCEREGDTVGAFVHYFALHGIMSTRAAMTVGKS